jgi:TonB family protein
METLIYIGKVSLYWTLFYLCYRLFLRQQTFFVLNRLYLIGALLISFALPFVIYPESAPEMPVMYEVSAAAFTINYVPPQQAFLTWTNTFILAYVLGVLFMGFTFYRHILQLIRFLREGELIELEDCKIVLIDSNHVGSFSFLKWIVINRNNYENHFDAILRHEMVHTSQGHSFDILFIELLRIVFWFNPILSFYKNALQEVHEYLADEAAPNREHYATFLVSYALNAPIAALTNHFFKPSQLKNRIQMIYRNRTSRWFRTSYILAFSLIGAVAVLIAGCEKIKKNFSESTAGPGQEMDSAKTIRVEGVVTAADKMAIPGANIVVKGMSLGTTTDSDGKFVINAPAHSTLIISFQGFATQLRPLNGIAEHIIALSPGRETDQELSKNEQHNEPSQGKMPESGKDIPELKVQTLELNETKDNKVFMVVEKQPEFPGGTKAMYQFISKNIRYPKTAVEANVSGRVFLSFIVFPDGRIGNIMVLKGIGFGCDQEAVRVVSSFPKWEPGRQDGKPVTVKYNLPIAFLLEEGEKVGRATRTPDKENQSVASAETNRVPFTSSSEQSENTRLYNQSGNPRFSLLNDSNIDPKLRPLYIIDGKPSEDPDVLSKLEANSIESISVLKGVSAHSIYGPRGENGVILITSKKNSVSK